MEEKNTLLFVILNDFLLKTQAFSVFSEIGLKDRYCYQ